MARLRRSSRVPATGFRPQTSWELGPGSGAATALSGSTPAFMGLAITPAIDAITWMRCRGYFSIYLTLATAANDGFTGAVGIGLASLAAVMAGIGSVPTPITELTSENWLWHHMFSIKGAQQFTAGGGPGTEQQGTVIQIPIDSKAMRKLDTSLAVYAAIELGTEVGTAAAIAHLQTRILVQEAAR